jgi:hypothetical protein
MASLLLPFRNLGCLNIKVMTEVKTDNIYPVGMRIRAWVNPEQELVIHKYYQRIYYCAIATEPEHGHLAYFERELIHTTNSIKEKIL